MEKNNLCMGCMKSKVECNCSYKNETEINKVILKNRYLLGRKLEETMKFGMRHIGYDNINKKRVNIEIFPIQNKISKEMFDFLNQVRNSIKSNCKNLDKVLDSFEIESKGYIISEYLDGYYLDDFISKYGILKEEKMLEITDSIMKGLKEIHSREYLHLEINPENIFITNNNIVKLKSYGILEEEINKKDLMIFPDPKYPLEVYSENKKIGKYTDIYSLSSIIFYMLTGKKLPPTLERLPNDNFKEPKKLVKLDKKINDTIVKGLELKPENRYRNLKEFRRALFQKKNSKSIFNIFSRLKE